MLDKCGWKLTKICRAGWSAKSRPAPVSRSDVCILRILIIPPWVRWAAACCTPLATGQWYNSIRHIWCNTPRSPLHWHQPASALAPRQGGVIRTEVWMEEELPTSLARAVNEGSRSLTVPRRPLGHCEASLTPLLPTPPLWTGHHWLHVVWIYGRGVWVWMNHIYIWHFNRGGRAVVSH